jgi:hypothetical protein
MLPAEPAACSAAELVTIQDTQLCSVAAVNTGFWADITVQCCKSETFCVIPSRSLVHSKSVWIVCNLLSYPEDDHDGGRNMSVTNNK